MAPMEAVSKRACRNPWTMVSFVLVVVFLVLCAIRIAAVSIFCLGPIGGLLQIADSPGAASMLAMGSGNGIDVAVVEAIFGEKPFLPKGLLIQLVSLAALCLYLMATCIPLVAGIMLISKTRTAFCGRFHARLWAIAAASSFLTLQLVATLVVLVAAFMFAKGCGVSRRSLARGAVIVSAIVLCVFAACAAYVVYVNGQMEQLLGDIDRVADGEVPADSLPDSWPDAHLVPEFDQEGEQTSRVKVTHDLPMLWGDRGTMRLYIEETFDKGTAHVTHQHDSLRLWLKKVDGVWEIESYYWHP